MAVNSTMNLRNTILFALVASSLLAVGLVSGIGAATDHTAHLDDYEIEEGENVTIDVYFVDEDEEVIADADVTIEDDDGTEIITDTIEAEPDSWVSEEYNVSGELDLEDDETETVTITVEGDDVDQVEVEVSGDGIFGGSIDTSDTDTQLMIGGLAVVGLLVLIGRSD